MTSLGIAAAGCVGLAALFLRRKDTVETGQQPVIQFQGCSEAAQNPITRAGWGAESPLVSATGWGENGPYDAVTNPNGWLVYDQPLEEVLDTLVIHHSALPLSDGPREIQRLHQEERGFADIGYHFLIDENGRLYEGRAINVRGAHTYGQNYGSIGICLIGNFEILQPAENQLAMLRSLLTCLTAQYPAIRRLAGHRDFNAGTLCPGANLEPLLPGLAEEYRLVFGV